MYNKNIYFIIKLTETVFYSKLYTFLNSKYFFDVIYNNYIIKGGFSLGYKLSEEIDKGIIELVGPYGISNLLTETAKNIAKFVNCFYCYYSFVFLVVFVNKKIFFYFGAYPFYKKSYLFKYS